MTKPTICDIQTQNHGSVVILYGVSRTGAAWLAEHLEAPALRWGTGYAAEPRYIAAIIEGAREDGLEAL